MTTATDAIRVYFASLSDYNAGRLHGVHVTLDETTTTDEVWEQINAMLAASPEFRAFPQGGPAEEWAIHDYEGFHGIRLGEGESIERVVELAAFISEHGEAGAAFIANYGADADLDGFEESYCGTWDSERAYAEESVAELGWCGLTGEQLEEIDSYLDWDAITRTIFQGDQWSASLSDYTVAVFRSV